MTKDRRTPPVRPVASATIAVLGLGIAYLAIGCLISRAYLAMNVSGHVRLDWARAPRVASWVLPGLLLIAFASFLRRHRWAAALAAVELGLSVLIAFALLARVGMAFGGIPWKATVFAVILFLWLGALAFALARLRLQWAWLGQPAARRLGSGFPVTITGGPPPSDQG